MWCFETIWNKATVKPKFKSDIKTMLVSFFWCQRRSSFRSDSGSFKEIEQQRSVMSQTGEWFFHHDNAPSQTAVCITQFLTENDIAPLLLEPYSLYLAPCYFLLFPRKKGNQLDNIEEVNKKRKWNCQAFLKATTKNVSNSGNRWEKYISCNWESGWGYFAKNK